MDDIREQMDIANEINDAISQPLGDPIDEASIFLRAWTHWMLIKEHQDDLEAELLELESENLDEQLLGLNTTAPATAVPATKSTLRNPHYKLHLAN